MVQNGQPLGQMMIKLGLDSSAFSNSLTGATRATKTAVKEMQATFRMADNGGKSLSNLKAKQDALTKTITAQKNELTHLKTAYDNTLTKTGQATSKTAAAAQKYNEASAKLSNYEAQLRKAAGEMARLQVETQGVTGWINKQSDSLLSGGKKLETFGNKMSNVGKMLTVGLTAPITLGIGASIKAASEFESAFAGVKKTVYEAVDSNGRVTVSYADLEKGIRNMSKELPATASEISSVAENAGQLGIQTENVLSFTRTMIDMGEATNLSSEDAAQSLAKLANITQMSQGDFDKLGSSIVALGNNTATTERDIVEMSLRLAGSAKQANMTESDILGIAAAMSSVGINAEAGGGSMSRVMQKIQTSVMSGNDELELFAKTSGMTSKEFKTAWETDASKAITSFVKGLGKAKTAGKDVTGILKEMGISSTQEIDTMLRLSGAGETLSKTLKISANGWKENTALTKEAETRYATTESQLKMLKNEVNDVAIEFGGPMTKSLRDMLQASKPVIKSVANLAESFSKANPETQQAIMKGLALTAALGPLTSVLGKTTSAVGKSAQFVGNLGKKYVEMKASAAEAKAISKAVGTSMSSVASGTGLATKGVGSFTAGLSALGPVGWGIVGAGGLLAVGYGAWKLWGEEAWNAGQRTKRWGSDVGESTDKALTSIQTVAQDSSGQFGLMAQGLETNTTKMVGNFQKIGSTIENELTGRIEAFNKAVTMMPEELQGAAEEIVKKEQEKTEEVLKIVTDNNQRVLDIKKKHVDSEGQVTAQGAKMIQDLMKQSTTEYLNITVKDADARKEVMNALNSDITSATEEQASKMLQTLGKQRQQTVSEYSKNLEDYKSYLKDKGILDTDAGKELVRVYEEAKEQSTQAFDAQMALIVDKYPDLINEVSLANGQLASSMGEAGTFVADANEEILLKAENLSNKLAETSRKNAEQIKWTADETTQSGKIWNSLELIDKEGNVKTNAAEIVTEATKDTNTWNQMRLVIHEANLDSNAKKVIGEAAIANNWWDGMAYEDKKAILQDDFSITIYDALKKNGDWDSMSFEEKKAILYSNTPEVMSDTLLELGLWDKYQPEIKDLKADNYEFLLSIQESETKLTAWNNTPAEAKQLLANNMDFTTKLFESETTLNRWNSLTPEQKTLLASNSDVLQKVLSSETTYNNWLALPEKEKKLSVNNADALNKTNQSQSALDKHNKTGMLVKQLKANNTDSTSKTNTSQSLLDKHNRTGMLVKQLKANNSDSVSKINTSQSKLDKHNSTAMNTKNLTANNSNAVSNTQKSQNTLDTWNRTSTPSKSLNANTNAASAKYDIDNMRSSWNNTHGGEKTFTFKTVFKSIGKAVSGIFNEKGTNYHPGGNMIVNDQQGSTYRELVTYPNGQSFIPEGRNVFIPNAPRGTKVLKASDTKRSIPRYADGIGGVPKNSNLIKTMKTINANSIASEKGQQIIVNNNPSLEEKINQLVEFNTQVVQLLQIIANKELIVDKRSLVDVVDSAQGQRVNMSGRGLA